MAAAAQQSMPGEALYPIKRGIERAEAGLSMSTAGKGQDLLEQANDRLAEVENLLAGDSMTAAPRVPQTLIDFTEQAQEGSGLLMASFEDTRDPATIVSVREFTANATALLQDLARTAPAEAQDELAAAALALGEIDREATALCGGCASDIPELEVPGIFLAATEVDRALAVIDAGSLDNSHPFIVGKRSQKQAEDALTPSTGDAGTGIAPQAPTGEDPSSPALGLPGSETDVSKGDKDAKKSVEKTLDDTVGQITDGLAGVVETVLPDPLAVPE
jgi:hypothetical protein